MDLLILTSALDRSASAMTSATVTTGLSAPDALPQLVVGTVEPMTVKHYSAASTLETWSDSASYTVVASLGVITANGLLAYASATLGTIITGGKSGNLPLTTTQLVDYMELRRGARAVLTLQITVTDGSGNKRVYAQLPVNVVGTVPSFTQT